jgi:uncharacterized protein (TIGR02271 family)
MAAKKQHQTIVGIFEDRVKADQAVRDLRAAGFSESQIGVVTRHDRDAGDAEHEEDTHADTGALAGALTGAGLGALAGLGILAGIIPVVGPALAGGTLGVILTNAAAGAGIAGITGALIGAGMTEEEASWYEGEVHAGRTMVTVPADGPADEARAILSRHGAYDMQSRGTSTTATGRGTAAAATATGAAGQKLEVREEQLRAHTRPVQAGEVRVRKEVTTERKTLEVPVEREEVVIERHAPAGGKRVASDEIRPGEELRIPVKEEEVIVDKEAVVKEEVTVGKRKVHDTERVSGDVRKEQVRVERKGDVDLTSEGCDPATGRPRRS